MVIHRIDGPEPSSRSRWNRRTGPVQQKCARTRGMSGWGTGPVLVSGEAAVLDRERNSLLHLSRDIPRQRFAPDFRNRRAIDVGGGNSVTSQRQLLRSSPARILAANLWPWRCSPRRLYSRTFGGDLRRPTRSGRIKFEPRPTQASRYIAAAREDVGETHAMST